MHGHGQCNDNIMAAMKSGDGDDATATDMILELALVYNVVATTAIQDSYRITQCDTMSDMM